MRYWLMKSEPDEFSIDDLAKAPRQTTAWFGVRNYQARNFMRDDMRVGDRAFFYHSSCPEPGIAGRETSPRTLTQPKLSSTVRFTAAEISLTVYSGRLALRADSGTEFSLMASLADMIQADSPRR